MDPTTLVENVARLDENQKTIFKRLDVLETQSQATFELAASMREMNKRMERMEGKLDVIEREPAENARYYKRSIVNTILQTITGAAVGALLTLIASGLV